MWDERFSENIAIVFDSFIYFVYFFNCYYIFLQFYVEYIIS